MGGAILDGGSGTSLLIRRQWGTSQKEAKEQEGHGSGAEHPRQRGRNGADVSGANWQGGGQWERGATQVARHSPVGASEAL